MTSWEVAGCHVGELPGYLGCASVALFFAALNIGSIQLPIVMKLDSALAGVPAGALVLFVVMMDGVRRRLTTKEIGDPVDNTLIIGLAISSRQLHRFCLLPLAKTISERAGVIKPFGKWDDFIIGNGGFRGGGFHEQRLLGFITGALIGGLVAFIVAFSAFL